VTARRRRLGRVLSAALALVALAFVVWVVPVRDRCWDPRAPASTRVTVSRDAAGCVLHLKTGALRVDAPACAALRCEPGVASTFERARPGMLAALLLLYGAGTLAWAARWRALLGFAGIDLSLSRESVRAHECACPLANASYTNLLLDAPSLARVTAHMAGV